MNIKLIVGSILGIGSLGGSVAGGYYLLNPENSQKQQDISDSGSKSSVDSETSKSADAEKQITPAPNPLTSKPTALTPPSTKAEKGPDSEPDRSGKPQSTESEAERATADGPVQGNSVRDLI